MIAGELPVHFATPVTASALRAGAAGALREIRGWTTEDDLFRALAQALQLPDYFGHNWDALDECLRDVDDDVVLLVHDAGNLFRDAPNVATMLVDVWLTAAETSGAKLQLVFVW